MGESGGKWEREGQILTPNELDLTFGVPVIRCKVSSKLSENCDRKRGHRQTDTQTHAHTDTSYFIICPMLCYSNGTDKHRN